MSLDVGISPRTVIEIIDKASGRQRSSIMAPAQKPQRKTRRSRKRARANSYEVSSDSDSDAGSSTPVKPSKTTAESAPASKMEVDGASSSSSDSSSSGSSDSSESDSDDSDSSSSSSSSSSSGGSTRAKGKGKAAAITRGPDEVRVRKRIPQIRENSPTPPPVSIPGFLSSVSEQGGDEGDRRSRFRKVYMEKLVEGFGSDLDKLRTVRLLWLLSICHSRIFALIWADRTVRSYYEPSATEAAHCWLARGYVF